MEPGKRRLKKRSVRDRLGRKAKKRTGNRKRKQKIEGPGKETKRNNWERKTGEGERYEREVEKMERTVPGKGTKGG